MKSADVLALRGLVASLERVVADAHVRDEVKVAAGVTLSAKLIGHYADSHGMPVEGLTRRLESELQGQLRQQSRPH